MKKSVLTGIIVIVVVLAIFVPFFIKMNETVPDSINANEVGPEEDVENAEELFKMVESEIEDYCLEFENLEGAVCPACRSPYGSYRKVDCYSYPYNRAGTYCAYKENGNYNVNVSILLAWGGRNDQPGIADLSFTIDENKNIIERNFENLSCM